MEVQRHSFLPSFSIGDQSASLAPPPPPRLRTRLCDTGTQQPYCLPLQGIETKVTTLTELSRARHMQWIKCGRNRPRCNLWHHLECACRLKKSMTTEVRAADGRQQMRIESKAVLATRPKRPAVKSHRQTCSRILPPCLEDLLVCSEGLT